MNTYAGLHARYYDVVYADKPYGEEARFVDSLLREAGIVAPMPDGVSSSRSIDRSVPS